MKLQKRKHPKYHKPLSNDEKNKKEIFIKNIRKNKIIKNLYTLPLDIKIKIFQMIIVNHMNEWYVKHIYSVHNSLLFIDDIDGFNFYGHMRHTKKYRQINPDSRWLFYNRNENGILIYDKKTICEKKIKESSQNGIKSVFIGDNINEHIDYRQWSNWLNHYWYHEKCRCKTCDLVRITGVNHLSEKEKKRFRNISWNPWSDQWNPKSNLQLRYEKNMKRKIKRGVVKNIITNNL